jgi:hypothetical protein
MSKKRMPESKPPANNLRRKVTKTTLVAVALCIVATSAVVSRHEPLRRTLGLSTAVTPAPQSSGTSSLAKEYIYAGGRLIATEEPSPTVSPTPSGTTPSKLSVGSGVNIFMKWLHPTTGGTIDHYVIERKGSDGVVQLTGTSAATFTDPAPPANKVYLYRVQAVFTSGITSGYSNPDLGASVIFEDDPIVSGETSIRAQHINQLRHAVNDAHVIAGLGAVTWSVAAPATGSAIKAEHIDELWMRLGSARSALGLPLLSSMKTVSVKGEIVRAQHINDLRAAVR